MISNVLKNERNIPSMRPKFNTRNKVECPVFKSLKQPLSVLKEHFSRVTFVRTKSVGMLLHTYSTNAEMKIQQLSWRLDDSKVK